MRDVVERVTVSITSSDSFAMSYGEAGVEDKGSRVQEAQGLVADSRARAPEAHPCSDVHLSVKP